MGALMTGLSSHGWHPELLDQVETVSVDYPDEARDGLNDIEDVSPWFMARNRVIDAFLARATHPGAIVEVGAGNGSVALHLQTTGMDVIAVEPGAVGAANCRQRGVFTLNNSLEALAFPSASLPAIGLFDVLEHLGDPVTLVHEAHRTISPGGLLVVTVPAFPLLWSQADEFAGHHRRYRVATLDTLIEPVGFRREACSYFFTVGVPFSLVRRALPFRLGRRKSRQAMITDSINEVNPGGRITPAAIRLTGALEARLIGHRVRLPMGTSLGAVYRKGR